MSAGGCSVALRGTTTASRCSPTDGSPVCHIASVSLFCRPTRYHERMSLLFRRQVDPTERDFCGRSEQIDNAFHAVCTWAANDVDNPLVGGPRCNLSQSTECDCQTIADDHHLVPS